MTKHYCDICGKETSTPVYPIASFGVKGDGVYHQFELCKSCYAEKIREFKEFMKNDTKRHKRRF